jgi:cell division septal protein FtsQ
MYRANIYLKKNKLKKRRDYHKKILRNPFFFKDNKQATLWVNSILILIILFGIYYFFQQTSFWQIKNIYIEGGGSITQNLTLEISQQQQLKKRFIIFTQDKIIFFRTDNFKKNLQQQILLESILVNKNIKNRTIEISLVERSSNYFLINQGQYFTLDHYGNLISIIENIPATSTLPILDFKAYNLSIGSKIADIDYLNKLNYLYKEWSKITPNYQINSFELNENYQDKITINTTAGFKIYLSGTEDINKQIESLKNLFFRLNNDNVKVTEYIDISISGWIYYK